jgi:tetratricopeptide (TPR) repeat protein
MQSLIKSPDGLLRTFALIDRESIANEQDLSVTNDAIRLHRLVREIAGARYEDEVRDGMRSALIAALTLVYPEEPYNHPSSWPRCALLTSHVLAICETEQAHPNANVECAVLLNRAGGYLLERAVHAEVRPLLERALAIREKVLGPEHPETADSLNNLGFLLKEQGDLAAARPLYECALAVREEVLGPEHLDTAESLNNLAALMLADRGDLAAARPLLERALAIMEKVLDRGTAASLNNLAFVLQEQGDLGAAKAD